MEEVEKILVEIEKLRNELYKIIDDKESLLDSEIIEMSRELDFFLNKYNNLKGK